MIEFLLLIIAMCCLTVGRAVCLSIGHTGCLWAIEFLWVVLIGRGCLEAVAAYRRAKA